MLNAHPREGSASILILLTDGDPTSGYNKTHMHTNASKYFKDPKDTVHHF